MTDEEREHIEKQDINLALHVERGVPPHLQELYMECMNNKPMSVRKTKREIRDGSTLTHVYIICSTGK